MKNILPILLVMIAACNRNNEQVIQPIVQDITESVYASGLIKSKNQYQVFATVPGIIAENLVTEGDTVRKGDVIMKLVNDKSQLSAENAQLAARYSSEASNADRLNELQVNIDLARDKMVQDSILFQRQANLWKQEIGTRNELEQRELAWKNSKTAYEAALLRYKNLRRDIDFAARQSRKNLQISNAVNDDYLVKASQNGRVYNILKEPGESVNPQTPVAVIGATDEFILELQVDEYDIAKVKPGQKVFVSMDVYKGRVFEAIITRILPIMNERSRSFQVEAIFNTLPPQLYPNLTVEANILISTKKDAITIPRNYLLPDTTVILENGEQRKVVTGLKDYQRVEITQGIGKNDIIKMPAQ